MPCRDRSREVVVLDRDEVLEPDRVGPPRDEGAVLGNSLTHWFNSACAIWPHGVRAADFGEPLRSDVPALVLAGERDPVTPARYGREIVASLPRARSFVAYSNPAAGDRLGDDYDAPGRLGLDVLRKLGVPADVLRAHGAVSAACAEAMARGARERAGTDVGLSVAGIAGPDGGTPLKPVGTVFIGLADAHGAVVQRHRFDRDREGNKAASATHALDLLRRRCLDAG